MKNNQLKAGIVLTYISMFLGTIISLLYTPIMLRLLGQSEYGLYQLVASVVSYLSLLSFGFGSAYIRYYSRYKAVDDAEKIAKLNGMFLTVFSIIGVVALTCGAILTTQVHVIFADSLTVSELSKAKLLMGILVFNIAVSFPFSVFTSYITANEQYVFQRILTIVKTVANPFVVLPLLLIGYQSVGMVVATTILNITIEIVYTVYALCRLDMKFYFKGFDFSLLRDIAVFSSFIFLNVVVEQINWNVDKFLLGVVQGTSAVAVYGVASELKTYYEYFASSISTVFIPRVNKMIVAGDDDWAITQLFTKVGRVQFFILSFIMSGIFIFGQAFIEMWAGAEYREAYLVLLIVATPATIPYIQKVGIEIQRAKNMHRFRSLVFLAIAVGNLLISIPLCQHYGAIGCAIGTAIALVVGHGVAMNLYYQKKIGIDIFFFWKEILLLARGLIIPCLTGVIIYYTMNLYSLSVFLVVGILYVFIFISSMWFVGLNSYEKTLILSLVRKMKIGIRK